MNIEKVKLIEIVDNLHDFIKELEIKRSNTNIKNTNGLNALYDLYYRNIDLLNRM